MTSNELIHRYLLGLTTEDEVRELEARLTNNDELLDEFVLQAELDTHLRQEAQSIVQPADEANGPIPHSTSAVWKWVSGISTLAATVLLSLMILNFPPQQKAMAYPSLGQLTVEVPRAEQNIWAATADGDLNAVRNELENRVSVDAKAEYGLTPLHVATLFDQSEVAGLLLSSGADVSLTDRGWNTALHMAAFHGNTGIVRVLLSAGADPGKRNELGFSSTDLVSVAWDSGLEAFYRKLEKDLNKSIDLERIRAERPKILALLTSAGGDSERSIPTISVWQAVIVGNSAAVEQHIAAGTELNAKEEIGGNTPLMLAAVYGRSDIARTLIDAGSDLEVRNKSGGTALHQACFFCRPEIVKLLLQSGASSSATNSDDRTPRGTVTPELDAELVAVYDYVYDWLHLEFDLNHIKATRSQIAEILNEQEGKN
ncbi:MAG: ankyrin repeat protein [Planctomycetaceae bacterium]|jgi:ankyrin repeat protein